MKIIRITEVKPRTVYAIKTSTNTFIVDGLAHHNCSGCNIYHNTNPAPFTMAIIKKVGQERIELLNKMAKDSRGTKFSDGERRDLLAQLLEYKQQLIDKQLTGSSLSVTLDTWNHKLAI